MFSHPEPVKKEITVFVVKPDAVKAGKVEEIIAKVRREEICSGGWEYSAIRYVGCRWRSLATKCWLRKRDFCLRKKQWSFTSSMRGQ